MSICTENGVEVLYRYKYLPFSDGSLKMITDGTLKFTCPLDFNDPFDCMPAYDPESIASLGLTRPDLIQRLADHFRISFDEAKKIAMEKAHDSVESGEFARSFIKELGVVSLSRTPSNILMWSHYADHHKGFVVELRIPMNAPLEYLDKVIPLPVEYRAERPVFSWASGFDLEGYFLVKSDDWSYEQEERILSESEGPGIHPYSRENFLHSIIAGGRISDDDYKVLDEAVLKASNDVSRRIPIYRAEIAMDKYKVYIPGHPSSE